MSDRYKAIQALLDDPLNLACFLREYERRKLERVKLLLPPLQIDEQWVYPEFKGEMKNLRTPGSTPHKGMRPTEALYQIYQGDKGWYILGCEEEDLETGPFASLEVAMKEVKGLATTEGFITLDRMPWSNEDVVNWPI